MRVEPVRRRVERARFIDLPWKIYRDDPNWVPPLKASVRALLDTAKHPFYDGGVAAEAELFIAWDGPDAVGRVAAILNHRHNQVHEENVVFFGFFRDHRSARRRPRAVDRGRKMGRETWRQRGARAHEPVHEL